METINPIEERAEVIQPIIDRLLYLSPEEVKLYKEALNELNERFYVNVKIEASGLRIYSLNKNLQ